MSPAPRKRSPFRSRARPPRAEQGASYSGEPERPLCRYRALGTPKEARAPAVSGIFYPEERGPLAAQVDRLTSGGGGKEEAAAVLVPHGSLASCGAVLGAVYGRLSWSETAVLIGPNHTGEGEPFGIASRGKWTTPLGDVPVDEELARAILRRAKDLKKDLHCHAREHALEVQIPFLQRKGRVRRIVPIAIGPAEMAPAQRIGEAVAEEILQRKGRVRLIGSANLTRYELPEEARAKDPKIIERILALDGAGLLEMAHEQALSLCGAGALAALMAAARRLGASGGHLLRYQTSAQAGGDPVSVVGYAGIVFQ